MMMKEPKNKEAEEAEIHRTKPNGKEDKRSRRSKQIRLRKKGERSRKRSKGNNEEQRQNN
jgi:hypothetical protein